jgi:hypothetical protein
MAYKEEFGLLKIKMQAQSGKSLESAFEEFISVFKVGNQIKIY